MAYMDDFYKVVLCLLVCGAFGYFFHDTRRLQSLGEHHPERFLCLEILLFVLVSLADHWMVRRSLMVLIGWDMMARSLRPLGFDKTLFFRQESAPTKTEADRAKVAGKPFRYSSNEQQQSSFFRCLPREIRDIVYQLLLTHHQPIESAQFITERSSTIILPASRQRTNLDPTLLCTCQRIYDEAFPILYGKNTFLFQSCSDIGTFAFPSIEKDLNVGRSSSSGTTLTTVKPDRLCHIRHLKLSLTVPTPIREWMNLISAHGEGRMLEFPGLRDLILDFSALRLKAGDGIDARPFIRKFGKHGRLDRLEIRGLKCVSSLQMFEQNLVKKGGVFRGIP